MRTLRFTLASLVLCALACTSPEAARVRGGGPGADPGNRDAVVEMHGGSQPYFGTPCRAHEPCTGPLPYSGPNSTD